MSAPQTSGWFHWEERLPGWTKFVYLPPLALCMLLYALAVMAIVILILPIAFLWTAIVGVRESRQRLARLKAKHRLTDFSTVSQHVANEHGWLLVSETVKGTFGEMWYDDCERNSAMISRLPSFAERTGLDLYTDDIDRRFEYYRPYLKAIEFVRDNVMNIESGTGILIRNEPRDWGGLESSTHVKVVFCQ